MLGQVVSGGEGLYRTHLEREEDEPAVRHSSPEPDLSSRLAPASKNSHPSSEAYGRLDSSLRGQPATGVSPRLKRPCLAAAGIAKWFVCQGRALNKSSDSKPPSGAAHIPNRGALCYATPPLEIGASGQTDRPGVGDQHVSGVVGPEAMAVP